MVLVLLTYSGLDLKNLILFTSLVAVPKILGTLGPPTSNLIGVVDCRKMLVHMCYCTKFGDSRSNRVGIVGVPKKFGGHWGCAPSDGLWLNP